MKKSIVILFIGLLQGLSAAERPNFYFTLGITKAMAPEEFKNNYLAGAHMGIMAGLPLARQLELVADVSYHSEIFDTRGFKSSLPENDETNYVITGDNANIITATVKAKVFMPSEAESKSSSYFFAGPGLYMARKGGINWLSNSDSGYDGKIDADNETVPCVTFGFGVELTVESTHFILELGPVLGFTETKTSVIIPVRLGLALKP